MIQAALSGKNGLVVLPTRELAYQVSDEFRKIGGKLGIKTALLIGGEPAGRQIQALRRSPQIVIGTPGRILDHLTQKTLSLKTVGTLVLDEADRMLDMGFAPQLSRILAEVPHNRQTMLFSATMPQEIVAIAKSHMRLPLRVEIAPPGTMAEKVTQEVFFVQRADKPRLLEKILFEYHGPVLVFSRTKFGAKRITVNIRSMGHTVAELHSNRSLTQRREALDGFRNGKYRILVATDIAARGIDVRGIELVLNFDLPDNRDDYVHRIGRTGRAGNIGHAITFATPQERNDIRGIERLIRTTIPPSKLPELPPARKTDRVEEDEPKPFRRGRGSFERGPSRNTGHSRPSGFPSSRPPARGSRSSSSRPSSGRPTHGSRGGDSRNSRGPRRFGR
jgi:ATP-dependent RNA helicase RhlE